MRRFLIGLTLVLLIAVSVGAGVLVARWPQWKHALEASEEVPPAEVRD